MTVSAAGITPDTKLGLQMWVDDTKYPNLQIERHYEFGHPVTQITQIPKSTTSIRSSWERTVEAWPHTCSWAAWPSDSSIRHRPVLTVHPGQELATRPMMLDI